MGNTTLSVGPEAETQLRTHGHIDHLDMVLAKASDPRMLIGDAVWSELTALGTAVASVDLTAGQLDSEREWERLIAGLDMVEAATAALYRSARQELRRFEEPPGAPIVFCDQPGPRGCGVCDACCAWGDEQHDARGER